VLRSRSVKVRIDKLLVERGLVATRERAQSLILAGKVLVNEQKIEKSGASVPDDAVVRLLGDDMRYVSRGGLKLEKALEHWRIDVTGRTCMDVGASTGGFTDCYLQHGAAEVIAVDTGWGQIDMKLRNDARVHLLERTNARHLTNEQIAPLSSRPIRVIAMDVSFISATLVLPAVVEAAFHRIDNTPFDISKSRADVGHMSELRQLVVLVKPQFEVGRESVGKGGIVRDPEAQQRAVEKVRSTVETLGGRSIEVIDSPITGAEGNKEFLLHAEFPATIP
jgi:23S rRNA (cytidine1920-2'-O)/16S rRNA (cytidine1409-2'-O)-methyltransferase